MSTSTSEAIRRLDEEFLDISEPELKELLLDGWQNVRENELLNIHLEQRYSGLELLTRDLIAFAEINFDLITDYDVIEQRVLDVLHSYAVRSNQSYYKALLPDDDDYNELENYVNFELLCLFLVEEKAIIVSGDFEPNYKGVAYRRRLMGIIAEKNSYCS